MAEIRNIITLDNHMSKVLEIVKQDVLKTIEVFGGFDAVLEMATKNFEIIKKHSAGLTDAVEKFEAHIESTGSSLEELMDNSTLLKEKFEKSGYQLEKAAQHTKELTEALEQAQGTAQGATRAFDQMTGSVIDFARNIGLIPNEVADIGRGMLQVNRTMRAAIPTAAKLTAALGPISLIAGALGGVFGLFRRDIEEEAIPGIQDLVREHESLATESYNVKQNWQEIIRTIERLRGIGISDDLYKKLVARGTAAEAQFIVLETRAAGAFSNIESASYQALNAVARTVPVYRDIMMNIYDDYGNFVLAMTSQTRDTVEYSLVDTVRKLLLAGEEMNQLQKKLFSRHINTLAENVPNIINSSTEAYRKMGLEGYELLKLFNELASSLGFVTERIDEQSEAEARYARYASEREAVERSRLNLQNQLLRSYRDTYHAAESLRGAHGALAGAIDEMNSGNHVSLDVFNQLMSLHPRYMGLLMNQQGGLMDVEDAVGGLSKAHIELMAIQKANTMLDSALEWARAHGSLENYAGAIHNVVGSYDELINARLRLIATYTGGDDQGLIALANNTNALRDLMQSAQRGAASRGVERGTTKANAIMVHDVAAVNIMGELLRKREDIARHDYTTGVFQQRGAVNIHMGGYNYSPNIYPLELSDQTRRNIIRQGAEAGAKLVADMMEDAYLNDLNGAYATGQRPIY